MKKINIQRDIESRRNMVQAFVPAREPEMIIETVKEEVYGQSEVIPGDKADTGASAGEKPKKRRRATEGNV